MRFLLAVLLTTVLALAATWWMPWWTLAVVAALIGFVVRPRRAFWAGFLGVFLLWLVVGLVRDAPNDHILATRMAGVLPLRGQWWAYLLVSAVIGGLVGGMAGWCGAAFAPRRKPAMVA